MPELSGQSASIPCIAIIGTCDTKLDELLYVRTHLIETHHVRVKLVDVGRTPNTHSAIDVSHSALLAVSPSPGSPTSAPSQQKPNPNFSTLSRNSFINTIASHARTLVASLAASHEIHGVIALGGSGGSALAAEVFAALPLGFPKFLVSTMACGDVAPIVRDADVAVVYSVMDIAGLNDILCPILENAAGAIAGMARAYHRRVRLEEERRQTEGRGEAKKRIAITMFGVTTPAVTRARELLARYPCTTYVIHANGAGDGGFFDGVLDITTTELADELVGGVLSAGPHRLEAAARKGVPQVVSLGALDMVNFGPRETVPRKWMQEGAGGGRGGPRKIFEHNANVTLMRTSKEECAQLGRIMAEKLRRAPADKTEVWIPRGGVSVMSVKGAPYEDPDADEALFSALKEGLEQRPAGDGYQGLGSEHIAVIEADEDVNNPHFVDGMVESLVKMMHL